MSDETPKPYVSKIDRRTAITWIGVVGAATAAAGVVVYGPKMGGKLETRGYGTDPNLVEPAKAPWPRILTPDQLQTAAILADYILPASATAPSASALGIPDFIDEWVSAPYPDQVASRARIVPGLKDLGRKVLKAGAADRAAALKALHGTPFFIAFRKLTIGAYYTTKEGFQDIGYIGNVARVSDPGPSDAVKAVLERELKKLGL